MKIIRKLNVLLLVVTIICTVVFAIISSNQEKYGDYDKKIVVSINDITANNSKVKVKFNVGNNGEQGIRTLELDLRITNRTNYSQTITKPISCNFYSLTRFDNENLEIDFYNSGSAWINDDKSDLMFTYKINEIEFSSGKTYTSENATFKTAAIKYNTQGGNSDGGNSGGNSGGGNSGGDNSTHSHNYNTLKTNDTEHWYECSCGEKATVEAHNYNILKTNDTEHWYECSCGEKATVETHNYNTLKTNDTEHWYECSCGVKNNKENHKGGTANCIKLAECEVCGEEYGDFGTHTYSSEWTTTDTHHYQQSTCGCDVKKDFGVHFADESGFCTTCDLPINPTEGLIIDVSSDGTYAEVVGYSGSATKINIPSTYNGLPVKNIYTRTFENSSITKVIIPDSVTNIESYAFNNCDSLTSVTIGKGVTSIGTEAFYSCDSLTSITIPDSVTSIGSSAFYYCNSLESLTIGNGVTSIGSSAFYNCDSLTKVNYTGTIDQWAQIEFLRGDWDTMASNPTYYADDLYINSVLVTEVNLTTATKISDYAFYNCASLTSITIGNGVTSIGEEAFSSCSSLTSVTIGNGVTSIGYNAFYNCNESLYTTENNLKYVKANYNPYCILIEVTSKNLSTYQINSLTQFIIDGYSDYRSAYGVFTNCPRLSSITIPDSVKGIGSLAFSYCSSLTSVTIGNGVTSIGSSAFSGCSSITKVNYTGTIDQWAQIKFESDSNPTTYAKDLYINDVLVTEVNLTTATKISDYAFIYCSSLTSVTIGNGVTSIGSYAFYNCDSLTNVTIGNGVTSIGSLAFAGCSSLTSVTIGNGVTSIGGYAFSSCYCLTSIKYRGSKSQWDTIDKDYDWDYSTYSYTITYNYTDE